MGKPRVRILTDGRIGWPDVVQYEITEGPYKGTRLTCPPLSTGKYRDPASEGFPPYGYSYQIIKINETLYDKMYHTGELHDPRHTGAGKAIDNRKTIR